MIGQGGLAQSLSDYFRGETRARQIDYKGDNMTRQLPERMYTEQQGQGAFANLRPNLGPGKFFKDYYPSQPKKDGEGGGGDAVFQGYLGGTRYPAALDYVADWFAHNPEVREFNEESYNTFLNWCKDRFLEGRIPGVVSFDIPSKSDVKELLMASPAGSKFFVLDFASTKEAKENSFIDTKIKRSFHGGLPEKVKKLKTRDFSSGQLSV